MFRSSRHLFSATIFLLLTVALEAQTVQVTFQVKAPPGTDRVTIAGNHPLLGHWDPNATSLAFKDSLFSLTLRFPAPTTIEYKFTRGSWNTEALNPDTIIPPNYRISLTADTTLFHRILFWKDQVPIPLSGVTGKVNIHPHFFSPELGNERTILVWLPPSYATTDRRYPVLYLQDGQNVFNPATSFAGHDWRLDETATRLIQEGLIREIIMVGIYNTPEREAEYNPELKGHQYSQFLVQTVKPFIDSTYRTLPDPLHTAVMGSSMGGLIAFYLGWEYPQVFSMVACLSPAFLVNHSKWVEKVSRYRGPQKTLHIILFNGTKGLEADLKPAVLRMDSALRAQKFTPGSDYQFKLFPGAEHNEQAWADQAPEVLLFFFGI